MGDAAEARSLLHRGARTTRRRRDASWSRRRAPGHQRADLSPVGVQLPGPACVVGDEGPEAARARRHRPDAADGALRRRFRPPRRRHECRQPARRPHDLSPPRAGGPQRARRLTGATSAAPLVGGGAARALRLSRRHRNRRVGREAARHARCGLHPAQRGDRLRRDRGCVPRRPQYGQRVAHRARSVSARPRVPARLAAPVGGTIGDRRDRVTPACDARSSSPSLPS